MDAVLLERSKQVFPDGSIIEIVIRQVSEPIPGSTHHFKYRLYFGRNGERMVGFGNECGKGDHCHLDGKECPYRFTTSDALLNDFRVEVLKRRQQP